MSWRLESPQRRAASTAALVVGAAIVVNVVLFAAMTRLNDAAEIGAHELRDEVATFSVQELAPLPPTPQAPPKEEPVQPKPRTAGAAARSPVTTPDEQPSLDLDLSSSLGGLALGGAPLGEVSGGGARQVAPPRPRVFRRSEVDEPVRKLSCDGVVTPALLERRQGVSGSVRVRAVVDSGGQIRDPRVVARSGSEHGALSSEALRHFATCRFSPARKAGRSVAQWVERVYEFSSRS